MSEHLIEGEDLSRYSRATVLCGLTQPSTAKRKNEIARWLKSQAGVLLVTTNIEPML
jgi:hypothetical protein